MNEYVSHLIAGIPSGIGVDATVVDALEITGTGSLSLSGDTLYLTVAGVSQTISLHNLTVAQVASQMPSGVTATVLQAGIADLLSLPNGATSATLPVTLQLPSNGLYYLIGMMARMLESRRLSRNSQVAQINPQAAVTGLLDWWGASTGLSRYSGEPDSLYAQRITAMRARPTTNNVAMQLLLESLGYQAVITDIPYGAFSVQITVPTSPPAGFSYSLSQLQDVISQVKAGGVQVEILVQASLTDSVAVTDSVTATLNNAAWTVGNVTVGQFNV